MSLNLRSLLSSGGGVFACVRTISSAYLILALEVTSLAAVGDDVGKQYRHKLTFMCIGTAAGPELRFGVEVTRSGGEYICTPFAMKPGSSAFMGLYRRL